MSELRLEIDQDALDREWLDHPKMVHDLAIRLADAGRDLEIAENHLKLVSAELDLEIREDPEAFDLGKITEAAVSATVIQQDRYRSAFKKVVNQRHTCNVLKAGTNALEHRKRALEKLVDLWSQDYFASPRAMTDNSKEVVKRAIRSKGKRKAEQEDDT